MKWLYLSIAGICAMAAIIFFCIDQDILGLICLINVVLYSLNAERELQDEKSKEQNQLIEALQRKVDALEELIHAIDVRGRLDYEHLMKRDAIIADTINKIETDTNMNSNIASTARRI